MGVLLELARWWLRRTDCQRLVRQRENEITVDGTGLGIGDFKIDLGSLSTKIKQFYRVTQTTVALDNSQHLLCDQISRLENEQLREDCIRIRLQLIMAFGQLHTILGSINERPIEELNDELARWVVYMSELNRKSIDIIKPQKKSPTSTDRTELQQIMNYQGVEENEMQEAMKEISKNLKGVQHLNSSQSNEQVLERYPYARFPPKIALDDIVPLEIMIKTSPSPAKDSIQIKAKSGDTEVSVFVMVHTDADAFEIQGDYYTTIYVPVESKDSIPYVFFLKAKKEGSQKISIRFFQRSTFLGELQVNTLVLSSKSEIKNVQSQLVSANWRFPQVTNAGPDLTLYVYEKPKREYTIILDSEFPELPKGAIGPIPFEGGDPESKFRLFFNDVENLQFDAKTVERRIEKKGEQLYDEVFPTMLKDLYWKHRDKIKSIRIVSSEPWIPWELIKPYRIVSNGTERDQFLCERYSFSRWFDLFPEIIRDEPIKKMILAIPSDTNLKNAKDELNWIVDDFSNSVADLSVDFAPTADELIYTLENEQFDILHITTHGKYNEDHSLFSSLKLENNSEIRPEDLVGMYFGKYKPLVIMNACQSSSQGFSFTKLEGWPTRFVKEGHASVFIGTFWSVTDQTALSFAKEFYSEIRKGTTIGEAVRSARKNCKQRGDPSWLAYQLYGHPNVRIKFG